MIVSRRDLTAITAENRPTSTTEYRGYFIVDFPENYTHSCSQEHWIFSTLKIAWLTINVRTVDHSSTSIISIFSHLLHAILYFF